MAFKKILVPLDGSRAAEAAIVHAAQLARAFNGRISLLHVLDSASDSQSPDSIDWRMRKAEASRYLHGLAADEALSGLPTQVELNEGRPAESILQVAERSGMDLIVMSAHGASGPSAFPFGGTAHKILSRANTSVAIVRQPEGRNPPQAGYRRVLVPIDGSPQADMALQLAVAMTAAGQGMQLIVLHLVATPEMPRRGPLSDEEQALRERVIATNKRAAEHHLAEVKRQFQSSIELSCRLEVSANPGQAIARIASEEKVDLMIMTCPEAGDSQPWTRHNICQAIQTVCDLPLVVLQANGRS
jgi:nucleotide-binding universal stress UspA family protein